MSIKIYSRYNPVLVIGIGDFEPSRAQEHFAHDCNIHEIIERSKRGIMPEITNHSSPLFGDFSAIDSYQAALEQLSVSEDAFMALDPVIRRRFNDRPGDLLSFVSDATNREEAIKLGLVAGEPPPVEDAVSVLKALRADLAAGRIPAPPASGKTA